jgi:hypothetical protein
LFAFIIITKNREPLVKWNPTGRNPWHLRFGVTRRSSGLPSPTAAAEASVFAKAMPDKIALMRLPTPLKLRRTGRRTPAFLYVAEIVAS